MTEACGLPISRAHPFGGGGTVLLEVVPGVCTRKERRVVQEDERRGRALGKTSHEVGLVRVAQSSDAPGLLGVWPGARASSEGRIGVQVVRVNVGRRARAPGEKEEVRIHSVGLNAVV